MYGLVTIKVSSRIVSESPTTRPKQVPGKLVPGGMNLRFVEWPTNELIAPFWVRTWRSVLTIVYKFTNYS